MRPGIPSTLWRVSSESIPAIASVPPLGISSVVSARPELELPRRRLAAVAGILGLRRLARELSSPESGLAASLVFMVWTAATAGIAGRLWLDLVQELS